MQEVAHQRICDDACLRVTLELGLLVGAGLLRTDLKALDKSLIKLNTSLVYRQQKYNLLREETEGFSKLLVVLGAFPVHPEDPCKQVGQVVSIMGQFDLDPNRALDVVLEAFEQQTWNLAFLDLLRHFHRASVVHVLGFKMSHYATAGPAAAAAAGAGAAAVAEETKGGKSPVPSSSSSSASKVAAATAPPKTPASLCTLAATLIAHDFFTLSQLLPYLSPTLDEAGKQAAAAQAQLRALTKSVGFVNLSATAADASAALVDMKPAPMTDASRGAARAQPPPEPDLTDCLPEWELTKNFPDACAGDSQLVGLATAFLTLRCWDHAQSVLSLLRSHGVDAIAVPATSRALCRLVEWFISDLYQPVAFTRLGLAKALPPGAPQCVPRIRGQLVKADCPMHMFAATVAPMLEVLTFHLAASPVLYTQLCRLLRQCIKAILAALPDKAPEADVHAALAVPLRIVSDQLLPALAVGPSNAFLSGQLWLALQQVAFQVRFRVYDAWQASGFGRDSLPSKAPRVAHAEAVALQMARSCLKRLTKDNAKVIGKQLGNVSHACPLVVYNQVLSQVSAYENLIPFVVEALKYSTGLSQDTMAYSLVAMLRKGAGSKVKAGETTFSTWFMLLSRFIATFYRKYPQAELKGLLSYLMQRLGEGDSVDLLVLKDLLLRMGGSDSIVEVSERQIEGLAGGRALRAEVMGGASREAPNKKAMKALRDELMTSNTALPLLLFIAQIRQRIIFDQQSIKLACHLFDTAQDLLMQFTDFLVAGSRSIEDIVRLMPPLSSLLGPVGLAVPVAFELVRPIMRAALQCGPTPEACPAYLQPWHPFSAEMIGCITAYLAADASRAEAAMHLSPSLFVLFWSLSLYDVCLPSQLYGDELKRLGDRKQELEHQVRVLPQGHPDGRAKRSELVKITVTIKDMSEERAEQAKNYEQMQALLRHHCGSFFAHAGPAQRPHIATHLMQQLLLPRLQMGPIDAAFCVRFGMVLHALDTPGFSTLHFADSLVKVRRVPAS